MRFYEPRFAATCILLVGMTIFAPATASGQNCPEVEAAKLNLTAFRSDLAKQIAQLQNIESIGPGTLADQDKVNTLRTVRTQELKNQLDQFEQDQKEQRALALSERNRQIADLSRERNELSARNEANLNARQALYNSLLASGAQTADLETGALEAERQVAELVTEKQRVIADLRSGKFCSECGRSAYEIEKAGGETFEQHLVSVGGRAIMRPEQIQARSDSYDQKISQARQQLQQLQDSIANERTSHNKKVTDTLSEITRLTVDGPAQVGALQRRLDTAIAASDQTLARIDQDIVTGRQRFADLETQRVQEVAALEQAIEANTAAYQGKVDQLKQAVAAKASAEAALKTAFLSAATSCQAEVVDAQQTALADDLSRRQQYAAARNDYADASYQDTLQRERARRGAIEAGTSLPVLTGNQEVSGLDRTLNAIGGTIRADYDGWRSGLGLRESAYYRQLDPTVRQKIDANIETFTSARNSARAVLSDSLGRFRKGANSALLRNALGQGNGISADLAAAVDGAKPSASGTLRRQLMPTIEAMAIETVVDARQIQEGRTFDPQERVTERGFARAYTYLLDPKRLGNAMIETFNETLDTFRASLPDEEGANQ